jgi:hypothetical protein
VTDPLVQGNRFFARHRGMAGGAGRGASTVLGSWEQEAGHKRCVQPEAVPHCTSVQAATWALEHCTVVAAAAARQLAERRGLAGGEVAAERGARPAADGAAGERSVQLGASTNAACAAVVQQARCNMQTAGQPGGPSGSAAPPLEVQHVPQRLRAAEAGSGEPSARERQRAAAQQRLRERWDAVQSRLPGGAPGLMALQRALAAPGSTPQRGARPGSTQRAGR